MANRGLALILLVTRALITGGGALVRLVARTPYESDCTRPGQLDQSVKYTVVLNVRAIHPP